MEKKLNILIVLQLAVLILVVIALVWPRTGAEFQTADASRRFFIEGLRSIGAGGNCFDAALNGREVADCLGVPQQSEPQPLPY